MTVLLSEPEFSDLMKKPDEGYDIHQDLRTELAKLWRTDKNFENFITQGTFLTLAMSHKK